LTLAIFYVSVGLGFLSAVVNLHFQEASAGALLPTKENVVDAYHGKARMSQLERLLVAHPSLPFNGQGSMRKAFTEEKLRKEEFRTLCENTAKEKFGVQDFRKGSPPQVAQVKSAVQSCLEGERLALIAWVRSGASAEAYEADAFPLQGELQVTPTSQPVDLGTVPITKECVEIDPANPADRNARIKTILERRCLTCHTEGVTSPASKYPLTSYEEIEVYISPEVTPGKSLPRLALTTHVHLLGFSVLYGLTGLIFAFSSYPAFVRLILAPLPLAAQVVDIAFWWLARMDAPHGPMFASFIPISGGIVATGLGLQIVLGLFNLFGRGGKLVLENGQQKVE
jgi:hypothetical protein